MTERAPESFSEACRRFSVFLQQNGYPERLRWVTQQDVVWTGRELLYALVTLLGMRFAEHMQPASIESWEFVCMRSVL